MKVALIDPVGGHGGMDLYDYGLAHGLGENNVEVHFFTSSQTNSKSYKNVTSHFYFKNVWDTSNKVLRLYFFLNGYLKSFKAAKKKEVKVVHLQFFDLGWLNFMVMLLVSLFNFRKVLTLHDVSSLKSKDSSLIERAILKGFSRIIVHNQVSFQELSGKISSEQKIHLIPHGNYLPFVNQLDYKPKVNKKLKLLFFGQIKKVKGLEILLKAMSIAKEKNKNIHLTIAGKPWHANLSKYQKLINSLGLPDYVTGHFKYIPNEKVETYFAETDLVILPYKKIYQSGVLLLSMSYGRVVLTSDLPAFKEIVEDGSTGFIFKEGDPESLARKILEIANNREQLSKINMQASCLLKTKFDWSVIGQATKKVYKV